MSRSTGQSGPNRRATVTRQYRPLRFTGFVSDLWHITKSPCYLIRAIRGKPVSHAFRERLMLAVTAVNGCRYCSWAHTGAALRSGVPNNEVASLLTGSVDNCPTEEAIALIYAQHWADSNGKPDSEAIERLVQHYDAETCKTIDIILHMIRAGNYIGIAYARLIERLSFRRRRK